MIGSHYFYKLSYTLVLLLKEQGVTCLAHAKTNIQVSSISTNWKSVEMLGLEGVHKEEWTKYTKGMVNARIKLNDEKYCLIWSWDTKQGQVSTELAYEEQVTEVMGVEPKFWYSEIWKWKIPMKIKLFVWLLLEQKILTWDNLRKSGAQGPSICVLCKEREESLLHLFGECSFIKII
jgi:hypothetical protein